jgi:hypothetical protein
MDVFKLRIKLGADEFEAEGTQEYVEKQRHIFLEQIETRGSQPTPAKNESRSADANEIPPNGNGHLSSENSGRQNLSGANLPSLTDMSKIATQQGDIITLSAAPSGESADEDSLMLLLLAHKVMRTADSVPTNYLLAGMKQSGRSVDRLDRVFGKIDSTLIIRTGVKRGAKYRLMNPGVTKARGLAQQLLLNVA